MAGKGVAKRKKEPAASDVPDIVDIADVPAIEVEKLAREGREALVARAQAYAKEYVLLAGKATTLLKNIARVSIALKMQHQAWGRSVSGEYKKDIGAILDATGLTGDDRDRLAGAIRWHTNNMQHDYMSPSAIKKIGLHPQSMIERSRQRRAEVRALVEAARADVEAAASTPAQTPGEAVKATADHIILGRSARKVLEQMSLDVIDQDMTDGQRAKLDEHLAEIQKRVTKLRRHTRKRTSEA